VWSYDVFQSYTGHFIMFSIIVHIYNKKTKGPTLMELFTPTGKLKKFFFTTRDVQCVHQGWHGTHQYSIQVLATNTSTWVYRYSSLLQWSVPLGQRGHVAKVLCVLCTKCTLHSNHRLTVCDIATHKTTSPPGRPFSHYIHSHRLAAEMWTTMKNTSWENIFELFGLAVQVS
jgi:hypothetical protein